MLIVYDANGMRWTFNKKEKRLYCIEAEEEMEADGSLFVDGSNQNGEYCKNWKDAILLLNGEGYMEK